MGPKGEKGAQGMKGEKGEPGESYPFLFIKHTQNGDQPKCPPSNGNITFTARPHTRGFSFFLKVDSESGKKLDISHSLRVCPTTLDLDPNERTYWLRNNKLPRGANNSSSIARCIECGSSKTLELVIDYNDNKPECLRDYFSVWSGYLFKGYQRSKGEDAVVIEPHVSSCLEHEPKLVSLGSNGFTEAENEKILRMNREKGFVRCRVCAKLDDHKLKGDPAGRRKRKLNRNNSSKHLELQS